jgi:hypothetical protein
MKRIGVLLLCLCLILTGCQGSKVKNQADDTITNNTKVEANDPKEDLQATDIPDSAGEGVASAVLKLDSNWTSVDTVKPRRVAYTKPEYEAKVPSYQIAGDLSNIENIDQFSGFTKEQIKLLVNHGFVVLPTQSTKMYYTYDTNEYNGVPNFITADTVLHLYHQFYDKSLIHIESAFLYKDLELMTEQMLEKSIRLWNQLQEKELKELQRSNVVYFLVARMLLLQTPELQVEVDQELAGLARQEYELCMKAESISKSPLLLHDVDYTQFTVRGHYTRTQELGRFFRTMMWFGTFPYSLYQEGEYQSDNVLRSLLMTYTTFAESEQVCDAELWSNIFLPTASYVGLSDDIDVFTMNRLRREVFGEEENPEIFNDKAYSAKLEKAVKALPEPRIQGKSVTVKLQTEKQFRFMGQRYVLDSDILQDLVEPILRPLPSGLDVMGVLGSNLAEQLQFEVYKPQDAWSGYTLNYKAWKEKIAGMQPQDWSSNLYSGWLWTITEALKEYEPNSGMPFFMTTQAWKNKALNTALASYTELKHDTVLYGKQAMAEMGGPVEYADYHYVEPQPELYSKLYYLTDYTVSVLQERNMLNESLLEGANRYKDLLQLLITCSRKELRNEPLTEEENDSLLRYGGSLENISGSFLGAIVDDDYPSIEISDMLVSDISSSAGFYLSLGTGYFDDIYVVAPMNGKLYLCRGSVYSHYEFISTQRLTDEEWWGWNGITVKHYDFADFPEIGEALEKLPIQPEWTKTFKSNQNNVTIKPLEIDWDKLKE